MKSRWHSIAVVILLAISASLLLGSVAPSSHGKGDVDSLKAALKQAGFLVPQKDSVLASFDMPSEVCCPADAKFKCMYNNVNAPYLVSNVEPGPGEVPVPLPNNNFHLGQNEALILIGQTPPPMAYFSYTVFMGSRRTTRFPYNFPFNPPDDRNIFSLVNDYVADSINNMTVHTSGPPNDPFNRQMLLFIVADQEVEARVREAARKAGYPPSMFNTIVLPPAVLHLGVDAMADSFFLVQRTAVPEEQAALDEYLTHPQTLLRVTLDDPAWQPKPIPVPRVAVRGTGETELDLVPAVDALGEAIKARYPDMLATEQKLDWYYWEGYTGLQEEINEMAPSSDAVGPRTDEQFFLPEGSFAMVYGVNHHATGKTSYSSFSLYEDTLWLGLDSVFDAQYAGSATDYLPADTTDVDKLYAWKIAWDCGDDPHCMTIKGPDNCARLTLTDESPYKIIFRLYLEPATKTGPEIREIAFDRVLVFQPRNQP